MDTRSLTRLTEQYASLLLLCCIVWGRGTPLRLPQRHFCFPLQLLDLPSQKKSYKAPGISHHTNHHPVAADELSDSDFSLLSVRAGTSAARPEPASAPASALLAPSSFLTAITSPRVPAGNAAQLRQASETPARGHS